MKKRILCVIFTFLILILATPFTAFADVNDEHDAPDELATSSIEYDFERYLPSFNLEDYKEDKSKLGIELIAMYDDSEYLYFYIYNPARLRIYEQGTNYINISCENNSALFNNHTKVQLVRKAVYGIDKIATKIETDALIIKYQIKNPLGESAYQSSYDVSEIELRLKNGVLPYDIGKSFIFSDLPDGSKNVSTSESKTVGIKELGHTFYRVQSSDVNYFEDIITVYFAVDKELIKQHLEFTTVKINWEECKLKPMLLVDDKDVESAFDRIAGEAPPANFKYSVGTDIRPGLIMASFISVGHQGTDFDYAFNPSKLPNRFYDGTSYYFSTIIENLIWAEHFHNTFLDYDDLFDGRVYNRELEKIYLTFYSERPAEGYVPGEEVLFNADIYDGYYDGMYSDDLFTEKSGKREATYYIEQTSEVGKYKVKSNYDQYLLNGYKFKTKTDGSIEFDTFQRFYPGHIKLSDERLSEAYLIDSRDISEFREFCAKNQDKEIYFLRYSVVDTKIVDVAVFGDEQLSSGNVILDFLTLDAECYVCNASMVETVLIDDLDIIQIGFDNVKGGYTAYGVVSEPSDFVPDLEQFKHKDAAPDGDKKNYLADLIAIVGVIIAIILLATLTVFAIVIMRLIRKRGKKNEKKNN